MNTLKNLVIALTLAIALSGCQSTGKSVGNYVDDGINSVTNFFKGEDKLTQEEVNALNEGAKLITRHANEHGAKSAPVVVGYCYGSVTEQGFDVKNLVSANKAAQETCLKAVINYRNSDKRLRETSKHADKATFDNMMPVIIKVAEASELDFVKKDEEKS